MKRLLSMMTLAFLLCVGSAFAASPVIVGHDANMMPFAFQQGGNSHAGFDIDLWSAIAKKKNLDYSFETVVFKEIISGLRTNKIDVAASAITINEERAKLIEFSKPYYHSGLQILVKSGVKGIKSIDDLAGKTVATKLGTSSETFLKEFGKVASLRLLPTDEAMFNELIKGDADAVIFDLPIAQFFAQNDGKGKVELVGPVYEEQSYGFALRKGSALTAIVNEALDELQADGTYKKIYNRWFGATK